MDLGQHLQRDPTDPGPGPCPGQDPGPDLDPDRRQVDQGEFETLQEN